MATAVGGPPRAHVAAALPPPPHACRVNVQAIDLYHRATPNVGNPEPDRRFDLRRSEDRPQPHPPDIGSRRRQGGGRRSCATDRPYEHPGIRCGARRRGRVTRLETTRWCPGEPAERGITLGAVRTRQVSVQGYCPPLSGSRPAASQDIA